MKLWSKMLDFSLLQKPYLSRNGLVKAIGVLVGGSILCDWGIGFIPFDQLPLPGYWIGIIYRVCSGLIWLTAIWYFYPQTLSRFKVYLSKRLLIGLLVVLFFTVGLVFHSDFVHSSKFDVVIGFLFSMGIGIDEDFFSRGLIFGTFESYGIQTAAIISSINFGLLHFGNAIWGGQSLSFTTSQVVGAMAFGYLCVGLMVYTKTIWVPVLFHGLVDFPMQLESTASFTKGVTGPADWGQTFIFAVPYTIVGCLLIMLSNPGGLKWHTAWAKRAGLVK